METMYNVEIQMLAECERDELFDKKVCDALECSEVAIDEREPYRMTLIFKSEDTPPILIRMIRRMMKEVNGVHFVDVIYHIEHDLPQRFTVRDDGSVQNYRTRIMYEEVR